MVYDFSGSLVQYLEGSEGALLKMEMAETMEVLLCLLAGNNLVWAWDLSTGLAQVLDFNREYQALNQGQVVITCQSFDAPRSVLISGSNDGSFFVRRLHRDPESGSFACRLLRHGIAQERRPLLTTLWYDSVLDTLYTGDVAGCVKVVPKVTGVAVTMQQTHINRKKAMVVCRTNPGDNGSGAQGQVMKERGESEPEMDEARDEKQKWHGERVDSDI